MASVFDKETEISWCPGCGDYKILEALKAALDALGLSPQQVVVVSGIGQGAKLPHYMKSHFANGLHGRALPLATGIKAANPSLTVIAVGGDGDMYGEGGNHFIHTMRRNPDITNIVCDNMVYGLTKGQNSPTTLRGTVTTTTPAGSKIEPFNPIAMAIAGGATFVARGSAADAPRTANLIKAAILHKGYALVDIFQPCVSFNKAYSWQWLEKSTEWLPEDRDSSDINLATVLSRTTSPYPLGIIYQVEPQETFEAGLAPYANGDERPLYTRRPQTEQIMELLGE